MKAHYGRFVQYCTVFNLLIWVSFLVMAWKVSSRDPWNLRYPDWQPQYEAALHEYDPKKLMDRVTDAENAIFHRLQSLAGNADHHGERKAIEDGVRTLRVLKREELDFPDWE